MAMRTTSIEVGETADAIRQWAAQRHLPEAHLRRWLALADQDRAALLELAEGLRLRTGQLVTTLELVEEIAVRESATIGMILVRPEIRRIRLVRSASSTGSDAWAFDVS